MRYSQVAQSVFSASFSSSVLCVVCGCLNAIFAGSSSPDSRNSLKNLLSFSNLRREGRVFEWNYALPLSSAVVGKEEKKLTLFCLSPNIFIFHKFAAEESVAHRPRCFLMINPSFVDYPYIFGDTKKIFFLKFFKFFDFKLTLSSDNWQNEIEQWKFN